MRRREFNASLLIASAAIQPALAQLPEKRRTIAIVVTLEEPEAISEDGSGFWRAFFRELGRLGHVMLHKASALDHLIAAVREASSCSDRLRLGQDTCAVLARRISRPVG